VAACRSENTIQELVAGALSGDAHAQARQHLGTCEVCRTLAVELARDSDAEAGSATGDTPITVPERRGRG